MVLFDLLGCRRLASRLGVPAFIADIDRRNGLMFCCVLAVVVGGRLSDCWFSALLFAIAAGSRMSKNSSTAFCCSEFLLATISLVMVQLCCTGLNDFKIGRG